MFLDIIILRSRDRDKLYRLSPNEALLIGRNYSNVSFDAYLSIKIYGYKITPRFSHRSPLYLAGVTR
jgi:hypothetical protein